MQNTKVDLDTWEPGEDVDTDALVKEELLALRAEHIPSLLRLSFTPAAIREHYEDGDVEDDPTAGMSDEDLETVGEWALSDDMLYREFHRALESALAEFKARQNEVVESPSGWWFRVSQENGDQVDCQECGNPLNDDLPIVNDEDQYAYHERCLAPANRIQPSQTKEN